MMDWVGGKIEDYAVMHSRKVPEVMEALREYTHANVPMPQMQVGPLEGNFLKLLVRITGAKRVLEVGTYTGYSGLMMASGLPGDGSLITCELNPDNAAVARKFFDMSPHGSKIEIKLGPASQSIAKLEGPFDLAFIDADKGGYITYFDMIRPMMRPGGLIVADNVLWSGRVLDDPEQMSPDTRAIVNFNAHVAALADLDKVMLTVRDGMLLIVC